MSAHDHLRPERLVRQQLAGKDKDKGKDNREEADDEDDSSPVAGRRVEPDAQCGFTTSVGPLGLDDGLPWETAHASAPASRFAPSGIAPAKGRAAFGRSLLATRKSQKPKKKKKKSGFVDRLRKQMTGASGEQNAPPPPPEEAAPPPAKKSGTFGIIRDCLSPGGLAEIRTMMYDPKLALTIPMREAMAKLGRYGEIGDKDGVRRTVADLAEKLNVGAPQNGTVLVEQSLAGSMAAPPPAAVSLDPIESPKRSVGLTQAGRTFLALAPILGENGTLNWKDGLSRGWQRLNERFAMQAEGVVDVLVPPGGPSPVEGAAAGAAAPAPPPGAVGAWSVPPQGAGGVGQWNAPPPEAAGQPGGGGVGTWAASPDAAKGAVGSWTASPEAAKGAVGVWTAPAGGEAGAPPPVGGWSVPGKDAAAAGSVGQWTAPAPEDAGGVGQWAAPGGPGGEGSAPPIGQWSAGAAKPGEAPGGVGQWNTAPKGQPASPGAIGQWGSPAAAPPPSTPAAAGAPPPTQAPRIASAVPIAMDAIRITDRMTLADVVQQNPNISGLRILEFIPQGKGPGKLREIANLGASLLKNRLG